MGMGPSLGVNGWSPHEAITASCVEHRLADALVGNVTTRQSDRQQALGITQGAIISGVLARKSSMPSGHTHPDGAVDIRQPGFERVEILPGVRRRILRHRTSP